MKRTLRHCNAYCVSDGDKWRGAGAAIRLSDWPGDVIVTLIGRTFPFEKLFVGPQRQRSHPKSTVMIDSTALGRVLVESTGPAQLSIRWMVCHRTEHVSRNTFICSAMKREFWTRRGWRNHPCPVRRSFICTFRSAR